MVSNEAIVQVVGEATRGRIQAMAVTRAERTQNMGPRLGRPMMKQPTFNCEAQDKYNEPTIFRLEVNNIFKLYSMQQTEQIAISKRLARCKRPTVPRIINTDGTRKM